MGTEVWRHPRVTYDGIQALRQHLGAPWFTSPWDINLVVLRSNDVAEWDDMVVAACLDDAGRKVVVRCRATGDASAEEWLHASNPDGCVFVLDQHVPGGLVLGLHRGRDALVQNKPFRNVRWPRDTGRVPTVDELHDLAKTAEFVDTRATNIHNRSAYGAPAEVQSYDSQGCTVVLYRHEHAALIELVRTQHAFRGTGVVSPTYTRWDVLRDLLHLPAS